MSGGSQHNPNGRQSQLGSGWSPLQLQMASYLARAPQAHMASERGVTWHTPTPPHLYHVPAPSPPDPLQAMKVSAAAGNSVFRHTATPPELYRHTPTPPDKHLMRHTPSPGDPKAGVSIPPTDLFTHLGQSRVAEKLRHDELYRGGGGGSGGGGGVDLSVSRAGAANGSPIALSVRDAPTINSLIARVAPRGGQHSRVDSLLERLAPSSPHSVIVTARHSHPGPSPPPSPPSPPSAEEEDDQAGAPRRKRKPERVVRAPPTAATPPAASQPEPRENGLAEPSPPHARRKTRSASAETIDEIAAMIAGTKEPETKQPDVEPGDEPPVTIDKLESVLASPEPSRDPPEVPPSPPAPPPEPVPLVEQNESPTKMEAETLPETPVSVATAPMRRTRTSHSESTNVPVESPSEGRPAEPEPETAEPPPAPVPASIVDVEVQLEKMFAGIDETDRPDDEKKRRKSVPTKGEKKCSRRSSRSLTGDEPVNKKPTRKKVGKAKKTKEVVKEYDSGSNASSGRSRGPYIQIRGPRDSPVSVSVVNASSAGGEEEARGGGAGGGGGGEWRGGRRGLHCSTLGLRYDATTPDATWLCCFCRRGPHACGLGDLFGPYPLSTDCDQYRALPPTERPPGGATAGEVWFHVECALWAPGVLARGARVWGLSAAVWGAGSCGTCGVGGATLACGVRGCTARTHLPCADTPPVWRLHPNTYRAYCRLHHHHPPTTAP